MPLDLAQIREHFPALSLRDQGRPRIYLDNPGGTQLPREVLEKVQRFLVHLYPGHPGDGSFPTTLEAAAILQEAHVQMAELINAASPREIVYGLNMTSLNFMLARALGEWLKPGGEIIVSRLGHEANISPWLAMAEQHGHTVKWLDFDADDSTLDLQHLSALLSPETRMVAVAWASNAIGTIHPAKKIVELAHDVGALAVIDGVQYIPHVPTDVQELGADFVTCSTYKFFGLHMGALWGRLDLLQELPAYKVRPAPDCPPDRFELGTQNYEGLAGQLGAFEYLAWVGKTFGRDYEANFSDSSGRQFRFHTAMAAIRDYEQDLSAHLIKGLLSIPGVRVFGITSPDRLDERVPTVSFTLEGQTPERIGQVLSDNNIVVWVGAGDYYAVEYVRRLGLDQSGGMVRVGAVHYNTLEELDVFFEVISSLAR